MKKINYLPLYISSFVFWSILLLMRMYDMAPYKQISHISAYLEFFLHALMFGLIFKIFARAIREDRKILFWLISINVGLFLNDFAFYILIYFFDNDNFNLPVISFILDIIPYSIWIVSVLFFLASLLNKSDFSWGNFVKFFSILLLINFLILCLFFHSVQSSFNNFSWQNISQITSTLVELIIYDLGVLCLIYSDSKALSFIIVGLIVLISGDFILNYSFLSQTDSIATYGELFWLLGMLGIFFGMLELQNRDFIIQDWLRSANSIKGKLAFWAFGISIVNILPFFILAYLLSPLNKTVFLILPPFLMLTSVAVVILSLFTAKHFEIPFKKIANNIESLMLNDDKSKFDTHFVIEEFIFLQKFILRVFDLKEEREVAKKALVALTAQVAHDIRSPLTALNTCLKDLPQVSEKHRVLMRNASNRINDIANNLLQQYSPNTVALSVDLKIWLLAPLVESIISEKRLQFEGDNIELESIITTEGFSAFAQFDASRMKRVLSNLINNAAESFSMDGGQILLMLDAHSEQIVIKIQDNGCGISADLLEKVMQVGVSFKSQGSGLGLSDAKQTIESFGGRLYLHSILNRGTTVEIILPCSNTPPWFVSELFVSPDIKIGILDDDQSVHDAWEQRLLTASQNLTINHFKTLESFSIWYSQQSKPVQIFSDYELLGESETGLDILKNLKLGNNAILVTSHYENPDIIDSCQKVGIRLLPKNLLTYIPIKMLDNRGFDLVLIDDDELIRKAWSYAAEDAGKNIAIYSSFDQFINSSNNHSKSTKIYIDSDLGNNIKGEVCAKQLFDKGFHEIYLATGYLKEGFDDMSWIKAIVGKEPPFY